ncbi:hypothetical protein ACHAXA_010583 [Cyclostephanos tholiformis]|uniref:Sulfotransferase n=1 Tax=Cyclostephanos tholiformis TaxID=382380 RepID=A0ABD3RZB5_9STRA
MPKQETDRSPMAIRNRLRVENGGENAADSEHHVMVEGGGHARVKAGRGKVVVGAAAAVAFSLVILCCGGGSGGGGGGGYPITGGGYDGSSTSSRAFTETTPHRAVRIPEQQSIVSTISGGGNGNWSQCVVDPPTPRSMATRRQITDVVNGKGVEPLWLPAYPTSLPNRPYADLIAALTGVANGARSYYRSSKTLRRCHDVVRGGGGGSDNDVRAITCETVHPIVPCLSPHPSSQSPNFGNVVLVALRNPLTAFPAYHQSKAEKYHGQVGQVERKEWIEFRDGFAEQLFAEWRGFIMEWRDMSPYTVGDYVPYEHWMDETRGPSLVIALSKILEREGFPVLYDADTDDGRRGLGCLWHKHIYEAIAEEEKKLAGWYVPKYSRGQLEFMATGLDAFAREIEEKRDDDKRPGDEQLITILREYRNAIRADSVENE